MGFIPVWVGSAGHEIGVTPPVRGSGVKPHHDWYLKDSGRLASAVSAYLNVAV